MSTQQTAEIYITNTSDGHAHITLSHQNSSNGTQSGSWNAAPGETVGPLTVNFETGLGAWGILDYWWISFAVRDGSNPGIYTSGGSITSPEWKECQLQSDDAGQNMTFTVNTTTFILNEKSGSCSDSMVKIAPYSPITNVFVLMLENHSFDNIFGMSGIPGIKTASTSNSNTYNGTTYNVTKNAPVNMPTDPGHEFLDVLEQLAGAGTNYPSGGSYPSINNSGFVSNYATTTSEGNVPLPKDIGDIMACFDTPNQLPVIFQLATEFAICDHWFSSLPGPTWPNRFFVHGASSAGLDHSPSNTEMIKWESVDGFTYPNGSIYDAMNKAGIKWRLYNDGGIPQVTALKGITLLDVNNVSTLASDLQGAYPYSYTFIEPNYGDLNTYKGGSSQHPMDDVYGGEQLIKTVYEAIRNSPLWDTSLLIITYDEHGGFYDSVAPGTAPAPNDNSPSTLNQYGFNFEQYGVRVPAVIVSPLIAKGTVNHMVYDHSSVLATVERLFGLNPLTQRDAQANDLRHLFSCFTPRSDCPTQLNNPVKSVAAPVSFTCENPTTSQQPLPQSGNSLGFLQIMPKTEFELSSGTEAEKADIIAKFQNIKTEGDAQAYISSIMEKVADAKTNCKEDKVAAPIN